MSFLFYFFVEGFHLKITMLPSILLLFGLATTALSDGCPPDESIFPCTCIQNDFDVDATVTCLDEKLSLGNLKRILEVFDHQDSLAVELSGLNLGRVPEDFFQGVNVKRLELWQCPLESLGERPLTGLEDSLETLIISASVMDEDVNFKFPVGHLNNLKLLQLSDNSIPTLGDDWFKDGPKSLEHLILSDNNIGRLGHRAFAGIESLRILFLAGNRFGHFRRSMLPNPASKLVELELDNNGLTSLPENMFSNMPALELISLQTNGLNRITKEIFETVWEQLESLDMRGNSLECDSHLEWMLHAKSMVRLQGTCQTPPEREGVELKDVITGKAKL
ncbi:hypothetical protein JTE90_015601 [Oedothorax gibbosus]|uniref:Uncharacterized protein n=1 Tax=Oedothorax gibbosus TaxID=931172 RepID=A0AAV6UTQ5_9ARAC|nr:hypothetical protein JTE90_015601 [Oedothorax gibbosus]